MLFGSLIYSNRGKVSTLFTSSSLSVYQPVCEVLPFPLYRLTFRVRNLTLNVRKVTFRWFTRWESELYDPLTVSTVNSKRKIIDKRILQEEVSLKKTL